MRLVRGLRNAGGEYNCFLNVIIQSLWHLRSFRTALLAPQGPAPTPRPAPSHSSGGGGGAGADAQVLAALRSVFQAMAAAPAPAPAAQDSDAAGDAPAPASGSAAVARMSSGGAAGGSGDGGWLVDPGALREALSWLGGTGAAVIGMELSEMHDAAEVFDEVLAALHRAEAGRGNGGGAAGAAAADPRLPRRVRARMDAFAPPAGLAAVRLASAGHTAVAAAAAPAPPAAGAAPAVNGVGRLGGSAPAPCSMVHRVFGLDVQVVAPADEEAGGSSKAALPTSAPQAGVVDALQFLEFAHFVHAQVCAGAGSGLLRCGTVACRARLHAVHRRG